MAAGVAYEDGLGLDGRLDAALSRNLARVSAAVLRAADYAITMAPTQSRLLRMDGQPGV